jgi:hypothetical protein
VGHGWPQSDRGFRRGCAGGFKGLQVSITHDTTPGSQLTQYIGASSAAIKNVWLRQTGRAAGRPASASVSTHPRLIRSTHAMYRLVECGSGCHGWLRPVKEFLVEVVLADSKSTKSAVQHDTTPDHNSRRVYEGCQVRTIQSRWCWSSSEGLRSQHLPRMQPRMYTCSAECGCGCEERQRPCWPRATSRVSGSGESALSVHAGWVYTCI